MGVASLVMDFKFDCILEMKWWNKLIFLHAGIEIQEILKLIQWFFVGHGQKWPWSFSFWDPKILVMNLGL